MKRLTAKCGKRATALILAVIVLCAGVTLFNLPSGDREPPAPTSPATLQTYPGLDLADPAASFQTLRYINENGGDEITRSQAIVWLDQQARTGQPAPREQESYLLEMLASGGHPSWDIEHTLWLFNSTFNVLHHSADPEPLTKILHRLAAEHPHRTMRLYALQHIGVQRGQGRLTGVPADQIHDLLEQQSGEADPEVSGSAIRLLLTWNPEQTTPDAGLIARALEIATSSTHPVDARITALHAARSHALVVSRALAADPGQPMLLRKAAIALIGQHGSENDLSTLAIYASESFRLAQAAEPARAAIQNRRNAPNQPQPIPF